MSSPIFIGSSVQSNALIEASRQSSTFAGVREEKSNQASTGVEDLTDIRKKRDFLFSNILEDNKLSSRNAKLAYNHVGAVKVHVDNILDDLQGLKTSILNSADTNDPNLIESIKKDVFKTLDNKSKAAKFGDHFFGVGDKKFSYMLTPNDNDNLSFVAPGTTSRNLSKKINYHNYNNLGLNADPSIYSAETESTFIEVTNRSGSKASYDIDMSGSLSSVQGYLSDIVGVKSKAVTSYEERRVSSVDNQTLRLAKSYTIDLDGQFDIDDKSQPISLVYKSPDFDSDESRDLFLTHITNDPDVTDFVGVLNDITSTLSKDNFLFMGKNSFKAPATKQLVVNSSPGMEEILGLRIGTGKDARLIKVLKEDTLFRPQGGEIALEGKTADLENNGGGNLSIDDFGEIDSAGAAATAYRNTGIVTVTDFNGEKMQYPVNMSTAKITSSKQLGNDSLTELIEEALANSLGVTLTGNGYKINSNKLQVDTSLKIKFPDNDKATGIVTADLLFTGDGQFLDASDVILPFKSPTGLSKIKGVSLPLFDLRGVYDGAATDKGILCSTPDEQLKVYPASDVLERSDDDIDRHQVLFTEVDRSVESMKLQYSESEPEKIIDYKNKAELKISLADISLSSKYSRMEAVSLITDIMFLLIDDLGILESVSDISDGRLLWSASTMSENLKGQNDAKRTDIPTTLSDMQMASLYAKLDMDLIVQNNSFIKDLLQKMSRLLS